MKIIEFLKRNWLYVTLFLVIVIAIGTIFAIPENLKNGSEKKSQESEKTTNQPIVVYGDSRTGHTVHQKIVDAIIKLDPAAVFHTGDLVGAGIIIEDWAEFNKIIEKLREKTKFYPALGNHELGSNLYFENFDLPGNERWYTVDIENIHFIILDSNSDLRIGSEQYTWLENDLKNQKPEDLIVAIFHQPLFSSGEHGSDITLRSILLPLFEKYGVDAVFNGHDHTYERSQYNDIYYIVSGGGGAPLYDKKTQNPESQKFLKSYNFCVLQIKNKKINVEVYNQDSELIDEFVVQ